MINFYGINKQYGFFQALKNINLHIELGEVVIIIGPSGAGKSTLLRCINGLEKPTGGELVVNSIKVMDPDLKINQLRRNVGVVFHEPNLYPHMTILENMILAPVQVARLSPVIATDIAMHFLNKVGLGDKRDAYPSQLLKGEQQRANIARALVMKPRMMIFDEPTSSLEPEMVEEVLDVIRGLTREGITIVMATEEIDFAREVADRVVYMEQGRILEEGNPEELFNQPKHDRTRQFLCRLNHSFVKEDDFTWKQMLE